MSIRRWFVWLYKEQFISGNLAVEFELPTEGYDYMNTMIMRGVRSMPVRIER